MTLFALYLHNSLTSNHTLIFTSILHIYLYLSLCFDLPRYQFSFSRTLITYLRQSLLHKMRFALVYRVEPTSPSLQSQHPHLRQSSCQNKSKALSRNRSVILLPHPAHSFGPEVVLFVAVDTATGVGPPGTTTAVRALACSPTVSETIIYYILLLYK